jgi:hypothetical protein
VRHRDSRPRPGRHVRLREGEAPQGEYPRGAWAPARRPVSGMREDRDIPRFGADETDNDYPAEA